MSKVHLSSLKLVLSIRIEVIEHRWVHISGVGETLGHLQGSVLWSISFCHAACAPRLTPVTRWQVTQYHDPFWSLEVVAAWPCGFLSPLGTQNIRLAKKFFVLDKHSLSTLCLSTKDKCVTLGTCSQEALARCRVVAKRSSSSTLRPSV